ncbi:uncharacterized protein LOC144697833 [Cetorhinus maximus]
MGILPVCTLCVCLPSCFSQSVVQTPAAVTRKECQSLTITCVFSAASWNYFQDGQFFRQTQTGAKWERIPGGGRFVVWTKRAKNTFSLEIRDVKVEDTATYYCKAKYAYKNFTMKLIHKYVDGSGTVVTVAGDPRFLISWSPPLQTSAAGDTVTLRCKYSGFCQYTVHWYRQSPGQAPEYLLQRHTSGEVNKENAAGGRISASIDRAEKISRLNISKLQLSDSAVYYCHLIPTGGTYPLIFGNGTRLIVEPSKSQTLVIERLEEGGGAVLLCRLFGNRRPLTFHWYRCREAQAPEWVYSSGDHYGDGFEERFRGSLYRDQNLLALQLLNAELQDGAIYYCTSSDTSDVVLTQQEVETGLPGQSLTLTCKISGVDLSCHWMYWYRQGAGQRPDWLVSPMLQTPIGTTSVQSDVVLSQPEAENGVPGQSLTLTCKTSGFDLGSYTMYWYRHRPGKGLEWIVWYTSAYSNDYNPEVRDRVAASKDVSKNLFALDIRTLTTGDSATYYCAQGHTLVEGFCPCSCYCATYYEKLIFGSGTQLNVVPKKKDPKEPTLSVFYPPAIAVPPNPNTDAKLAVVCLALDFSPKELNFSLQAGNFTGANGASPGFLLDTGYYRNSAFIFFRPPDQPINVACRATHNQKLYSKDALPIREAVINQTDCGKASNDSLLGSSDMESDLPRANSLSLTVMGLRLLFFKSIAFNVMMTARVWLF